VVLAQIAQDAPGFDWTPVFVVLRDALTLVVPAVVGYIVYLLRKNQQTTEEAKSEAENANRKATAAQHAAENGHAVREALIAERDDAVKALATERDAHTATRAVRDTYRDIFRYVNSRPDGRAILLAFEEKRKIRVNDNAADALFEAISAQQETEPTPEAKP
jgi:hypothetical protein